MVRSGAAGLGEARQARKRNLMSRYRCAHCKKVVKRDSNKAWIKSYCESTGKTVHLIRVQKTSRKDDA